MTALAIITACYILPICLAHAITGARRTPVPVVHPADPDDPNFDSMWEAARR